MDTIMTENPTRRSDAVAAPETTKPMRKSRSGGRAGKSTAATLAQSPEKLARKTTYNRMCKALRKEANEIRILRAQECKGVLITHYLLGERIKVILENEGTYGSDAVELLAEFFGTSESYLYDHRNVATTYSKAEVEKLAKREMTNGKLIEWGHLLTITRIKNRDARAAMWERTFNESLTVRQVQDEVGGGGLAGERRPGHGGRRPARPKSLPAGVNQVASAAEALVKKIPLWSECMQVGVVDSLPTRFDAALLDVIERAEAGLHALESAVPKLREELGRAGQRCRQVLDARNNTEATSQPAKAKATKSDPSQPTPNRSSRRPEPA